MKVVIDSNRIVAALLKNSTTRAILFSSKFDFITPEFVREELEKYKAEFGKKLRMNAEELGILLSLIFEPVTIISKAEYSKFTEKLKPEISDPKDIPYLACCIATHSEGIWSHDQHMQEQGRVKVFTNIDMLKKMRS